MEGIGVVGRGELTALIGRNIRLARALADMSQADVVRAQTFVRGERAFDRVDLSLWENGHRRPSDHYLQRIALATGQPLGWFYETHDDAEV